MENEETRRMLLVDEDLFLLDIYTRRLKQSGFDVEIATSEEEATEILERGGCGMVVLDVMIGNTPGTEVLKRLIEKDSTGRCAFVILTNSSNDSTIKKVMEIGADGYIVKAHSTPEEVAEELKKIYHIKRQSAD